MQKMRTAGIKTAEFAHLCNTTKRTLQYYDSIGLFSPAVTGENGYRYYSESQCDLFFTISYLAELGMPLMKIKEYADHKDPVRLKIILKQQKEEIRKEQERLQWLDRIIETKIQMVDTGIQLMQQKEEEKEEIVLRELPEEYFAVTKRLDTDDPSILLKELCRHICSCNQQKLTLGKPYSAIIATSDLLQGHYHTYAYYGMQIPAGSEMPDGMEDLHMPAGTYAVYYLHGDFHESDEAFRRLLCFCRTNRLHPGPYFYKEAILDEVSEPDPDRYLTRIAVRVCPV